MSRSISEVFACEGEVDDLVKSNRLVPLSQSSKPSCLLKPGVMLGTAGAEHAKISCDVWGLIVLKMLPDMFNLVFEDSPNASGHRANPAGLDGVGIKVSKVISVQSPGSLQLLFSGQIIFRQGSDLFTTFFSLHISRFGASCFEPCQCSPNNWLIFMHIC